MHDPARRIVLEVPWRTLLKILGAAALVWCLLQLTQTIVVIIVAMLLAVSLEPSVSWLGRHRIPRPVAAVGVSVVLLLGVAGFLWMTWSSIVSQSRDVGQYLSELTKRWSHYLPPAVRDAVNSAGGDGVSAVGTFALGVADSAASAAAILVLAYFLTIYLLLEGDRVRAWLLAFVPPRSRARAERTVDEGREVIAAYVVGNAITSLIATVCTFVALSLLGVPAPLFLALLAGLSDFVPVVGFIVSAIPAVLLAFTVSAETALIVILFYIAYNTVESYLLSPWAYGSRLRLSDTAVILAFAIGAELGGVIGALIALPFAALYPVVERIWLRGELPDTTVREHRALERGDAG